MWVLGWHSVDVGGWWLYVGGRGGGGKSEWLR
jgi:hypothetical protein